MMRPVYTTEYAESVKPRHKVPEKVRLLDPPQERLLPASTAFCQAKALDLEGRSVCDILTKLHVVCLPGKAVPRQRRTFSCDPQGLGFSQAKEGECMHPGAS